MSASYPYKWPREYAAEILEFKTAEQRRAALQKVPEEWRAWVKELVTDVYYKKKFIEDRYANRSATAF